MFEIVRDSVFPFLRTLGADASTFAHRMKDARFTIPTPALLAKVVDLLDDVPMADRDTNGDLDEYMLGKIATAGQNGCSDRICTPETPRPYPSGARCSRRRSFSALLCWTEHCGSCAPDAHRARRSIRRGDDLTLPAKHQVQDRLIEPVHP